MKKQKYYINLTDQERSEILSSLLIKKNELTHQGKFTDGIDEVICKLMKARTKLRRVLMARLSLITSVPALTPLQNSLSVIMSRSSLRL